jgi:HAD superfamily hydrolase (TIGR01509 family)
MKTKGVLFDLYGTLMVYGDMEKAWNAWYDVIYDVFRTSGLELSHEKFRPYCIGFFEKPEPAGKDDLSVVERRLQRLAGETGTVIPKEKAVAAIELSIDVWHNQVRLDPEAPEVLREIRSKRSLALVSNFDYAPYVHKLMEKWELDHFFDSILVSDAVGVKKPHPEIFSQALQRIGLKADQVVHVGDSQEDIEGAVGAGIRPVWIDRQRKDPWRARQAGEVTRITSLGQLLGHLD